jgi:hypothetical protein
MAVRIRTGWHTKGREHGMPERAGVVAATAWRFVQHAIKRMREAQFDIDIGQPYFDFVCEFLVFMTHVADRITYRLLDEVRRTEFTTALARRLADIVEDNSDMLLGVAEPGASRRQFIDLVNRRGADYAEFGYDEKDGADFAFRRYLGNCILDIVPPKDRSWVIDQVMEIEAPDAVRTLEKTLCGILGPEQLSRRSRGSAMGQ